MGLSLLSHFFFSFSCVSLNGKSKSLWHSSLLICFVFLVLLPRSTSMASNSAYAGQENKHQMTSPRNLGRSWTSGSVSCDHGLAASATPKCVCAPTTHAGSFKCRLHRVNSHGHSAPAAPLPRQPSASAPASTNRTVEAL